MAAKLVDCEHCGGKKTCTRSGGRSCPVCLAAAGRGKRGWATVRCSFCGGRGKVLIEEEDLEQEENAEGEEPEQEAEAASQDKAPKEKGK